MYSRITHFVVGLVLCFAFATAHAQNATSVSFASLLTNLSLQEKDGKFDIGNQVQLAFAKENQNGTIVIRKADGEELYKQEWHTELVKEPWYLIAQTKTIDAKSGETIYGMKLSEGAYVIDFYLEGSKFFTFPFSVKKTMPSDPFAGGAVYTLEGDWSDWLYLYNSEAIPERNLDIKVFLRHTDPDRMEKDFKIDVRIVRDKDKKLICGGPGAGTTLTLFHRWERYAFMMSHPEKEQKYGEYFKAKNLLENDGDYTLTVYLNEKPYGVWKFKVQGGKFVYEGRAVRGNPDRLTFIEGGRDAWWYKRVK